ncbi:MAG: hypothetical protein AB1324_02420 [Candidatus Micrarchaeota archaeon]
MNKLDFSTGHRDEALPSKRGAGLGGRMKRLFAGAALGLALAASPMLETSAYAQPRPEQAQPARREIPHQFTGGREFVLTSGDNQVSTRSVIDGQAEQPTVSVEGPAVVTLRIFPIIRPADVDQQTQRLNMTVRYTVGSTAAEQTIATGVSGYTAPIDLSGLAIGTPAEISVRVPAGSQRLTLNYPNGFVQVVRTEAQEATPAPALSADRRTEYQRMVADLGVIAEHGADEAQRARARQLRDGLQGVLGRQSPTAQQLSGAETDFAAPARAILYSNGNPSPALAEAQGRASGRSGERRQPERPVVVVDGRNRFTEGLGSAGNTGDITSLDIYGFHWFNDNFGLLVGASGSMYGFRLNTPEAETGFRGVGGSAMAGLAYQNGLHRLTLRGTLGYRAVLMNVTALEDGRTAEGTSHVIEGGGAASYSYSRWFEATVGGSNNPFNPIYGRVYGSLPYWWGQEIYPSAELDLLWLHTLRPAGSGLIGSANLNERNFYGRLTLDLPVWRVADVFVPSVLLLGDLNAGDGLHRADFGLGAAASFDTHDRAWHFRVGGGASPLTATPFFMLGLTYSR